MSPRRKHLRWMPMLGVLALPACANLDRPRPATGVAPAEFLRAEPASDPSSAGGDRIRIDRTTPVFADDPSPQEISRRRPQRPRGVQPVLPARFYALFSVAVGQYQLDDDVLGQDEATGGMYRFRIGGGSSRGRGAGVDAKILVADDQLFDGQVNAIDAYQWDVYAHYTSHVLYKRFRMPIRIGPYFARLNNEFTSTGENTDYDAFGFRAELEPEFLLAHSNSFDMSLFHTLSIGSHIARIHDDGTGEDYRASGSSLGLELGLRWRLADLNLSTSVHYDRSYFRESDAENGFVIPALETEFLGLQLTMGLRF